MILRARYPLNGRNTYDLTILPSRQTRFTYPYMFVLCSFSVLQFIRFVMRAMSIHKNKIYRLNQAVNFLCFNARIQEAGIIF